MNPFALVKDPIQSTSKAPEILMSIGEDIQQNNIFKLKQEEKQQAKNRAEYQKAADFAAYKGDIAPLYQETMNNAAKEYLQVLTEVYNSGNKGGFSLDPKVLNAKAKYLEEANRVQYLTKRLVDLEGKRNELEKLKAQGKIDYKPENDEFWDKYKEFKKGNYDAGREAALFSKRSDVPGFEMFELYKPMSLTDIGTNVQKATERLVEQDLTDKTSFVPAAEMTIKSMLKDERQRAHTANELGLSEDTPIEELTKILVNNFARTIKSKTFPPGYGSESSSNRNTYTEEAESINTISISQDDYETLEKKYAPNQEAIKALGTGDKAKATEKEIENYSKKKVEELVEEATFKGKTDDVYFAQKIKDQNPIDFSIGVFNPSLTQKANVQAIRRDKKGNIVAFVISYDKEDGRQTKRVTESIIATPTNLEQVKRAYPKFKNLFEGKLAAYRNGVFVGFDKEEKTAETEKRMTWKPGMPIPK
jgi:hypothetical protein